MSAFAKGGTYELKDHTYPYRRLEFGHAALVCMVVSVCGLTSYYAGHISAHAELRIEMLTLALKTCFELYFDKWGPDILAHHLIMASAFLLLQLDAFASLAYLCVAMQLIHIPLFFKYCWLVAERDVFFKSLSADRTRRWMHSAFWPSWLAVVFFRSPFMLCAAATAMPSGGGKVVLCFSAAVMYLDTLWTLEAAVSRSHGVLGAAVTEPNGWPAGLQTVKPWAVLPCFVGLACAVLPWGTHLHSC